MAAGERAGYSNSVDQAMNQVLEAEREARDAVERCRAEAARILTAAQEGVRRIEQHTERRIKLVDRMADRAVERVRQELEGRWPSLELVIPEVEIRELLGSAVDDLVEEILGERP